MKNSFGKFSLNLAALVVGGALLVTGAARAVSVRSEAADAVRSLRAAQAALASRKSTPGRSAISGRSGSNFAPVVKKVGSSVVKVSTAMSGRPMAGAAFPDANNLGLRLDPSGQDNRSRPHPSPLTDVGNNSAARTDVTTEAGSRSGNLIELSRPAVLSAPSALRLTGHPKDRTFLAWVWRQDAGRYAVVDEEKES